MSKFKLSAFLLIMVVSALIISCGTPAVAPAGGGAAVSSSAVDYFSPVKIVQIPLPLDTDPIESYGVDVIVTNNTAKRLTGVTYKIPATVKEFSLGMLDKGSCTPTFEPYSSCIVVVNIKATAKTKAGKVASTLEVKSTEGTISIPLAAEFVASDEDVPGFMASLSPAVMDKPALVGGDSVEYTLLIVSTTPSVGQILDVTVTGNAFSIDDGTCDLTPVTPANPATMPSCKIPVILDAPKAGLNTATLKITSDTVETTQNIEISVNALKDPVLARVQKTGERFIDTISFHGEFYSYDVGNDTKTFQLNLHNFGTDAISDILEPTGATKGFAADFEDVGVNGMSPCDIDNGLEMGASCYTNIIFTEPTGALKYAPVVGSFNMNYGNVSKKVDVVIDILPAQVTDNSTWKTDGSDNVTLGATITAMFDVKSNPDDAFGFNTDNVDADVAERDTKVANNCGDTLESSVCTAAFKINTSNLEPGYHAIPIEFAIDDHPITKYVVFNVVETTAP